MEDIRKIIDLIQDLKLKKLLKEIKLDDNKLIPNNAQLKELVKFDEISLRYINTSEITNMKGLFESSVRKDFSGIESWDTSNVVTFANMFKNCRHFNSDISTWDTSKAMNFYEMFWNAESFNQPIGKWNTSNTTSMIRMFCQAKSFNQPLDNWDTSKVQWTWRMFWGAESFNQPLNHFNVSKVTKMNEMFMNAKSFNQPLDNWDTSNVITMERMFNGAESFNQDLSSWGNKVGKVQNMRMMFANTKSLKINFLSSWNAAQGCDESNIIKDSALENKQTKDKDKNDGGEVSNFIISEINESDFNKYTNKLELLESAKEKGENTLDSTRNLKDLLDDLFDNDITKSIKIFLAKVDDEAQISKIIKTSKNDWNLAFYDIFGHYFVIQKDIEILESNVKFSIFQSNTYNINDFNKNEYKNIYDNDNLEIYIDNDNMQIINKSSMNNNDKILSITHIFLLSNAYIATMRSLNKKAKSNDKNNKNSDEKILKQTYKEICEFDLHYYLNNPTTKNHGIFLEIWKEIAKYYKVREIHDELKETISQIAQLVRDEKQEKLSFIFSIIALILAFASLMVASVPLFK